MDKKNLKKGAWAAGGVALLGVVSALCIKGMKVVGQRLKEKKEAECADFDETAEQFEDVVESQTVEAAAEESAEEPAEEPEEEPAEAPAEEPEEEPAEEPAEGM